MCKENYTPKLKNSIENSYNKILNMNYCSVCNPEEFNRKNTSNILDFKK